MTDNVDRNLMKEIGSQAIDITKLKIELAVSIIKELKQLHEEKGKTYNEKALAVQVSKAIKNIGNEPFKKIIIGGKQKDYIELKNVVIKSLI